MILLPEVQMRLELFFRGTVEAVELYVDPPDIHSRGFWMRTWGFFVRYSPHG